jgi:cysteine desulfurase
MGEPFIYFDHNATTPLHPRFGKPCDLLTDVFGNPSSLHTEGLQARDAVEEARGG